jgi:hypothetical protein
MLLIFDIIWRFFVNLTLTVKMIILNVTIQLKPLHDICAFPF